MKLMHIVFSLILGVLLTLLVFLLVAFLWFGFDSAMLRTKFGLILLASSVIGIVFGLIGVAPVVRDLMTGQPIGTHWKKFHYSDPQKLKQAATFIVPQADGSAGRIPGAIPLDTWQRLGKYVQEWQPKNLTQTVLSMAFPELTQGEIRELHTKVIGLLSPSLVGVIVTRNNHHEITYPEGWNFFNRVGDGRISPLEKFSLPYAPQHPPIAEIGDRPQHTRATRAE